MRDFPHMGNPGFPHMGNPGFPRNDGNVYRYENNVDYNVWKPSTKVKLLCVNWDSAYVNVPGFESDEQRNRWFDAENGYIAGLTVASELMPDNSIKLPFNFAQASMYNYMMVEFPDVPGATEQRQRWFYFINDLQSLAKDTTRFFLQRDEWVTFINDVEINGMMLERGHFPVAKSNVDSYLKNPIANNGMLLSPDFTASDARNVASESHVIINDTDMKACFSVTTALRGAWGSKDADGWSTPAASNNVAQGVAAPASFCIDAGELSSFLSDVDSQLPNFKQCVKAVFFAPAKLLNIETAFDFCGHRCAYISASQKEFQLLKLDKTKFGYAEKYADLAKLYTSPYARIEISDENGLIATVNVEDTNGTIKLEAALSLAFPALKISRHLTGINGSDAFVRFRNADSRIFNFGGDWYKTLGEWNVQTFAVYQSGHNATDFGTYYNRVQSTLSANNAYTSAAASADTGKANADRSANTGEANVNRSSSAAVSNTATQAAANTTITNRSNQASTTDTSLGNALNQALQAWDAGYSRSTTQAENEAQTQSAAVSSAGNAISGIASNIGNPAGMVGALVGGAISGATTAATTAITTNLSSTKTEATIANSQSKLNSTNRNNTDRNGNQSSANTANTATTNSASTGITARNAATANSNAAASASTAKSNATATQSTAKSNANRSKETALSAVSNSYKQGGLSAPREYGSASGGNAAVRPIGMFANVVTLPKGALEQVASQFKRFGYMLNQYVEIETFNVMSEFSYWKASDLWLLGTKGVPEAAQETIKAAIMNGVTVWRNPDHIGTVSVYDNN